MQKPSSSLPNFVVVFDGECLLCNRFVQYLLANKNGKHLFFATNQALKPSLPLTLQNTVQQTILVYQNGIWKQKSNAILAIAKELKGWHLILLIGYVLPRFLRDFLYDLVAKNRKKWFGTSQTCYIPSSEQTMRFLNTQDSTF
ncbi:MAG: hypothetical protein RLZZ301_1237 [Bacteroidota bacterium]|jgi:predicted DCC family thiol-disulfide oxidoreductase YuxK